MSIPFGKLYIDDSGGEDGNDSTMKIIIPSKSIGIYNKFDHSLIQNEEKRPTASPLQASLYCVANTVLGQS